ncbi:MAG TPA: hypothetical protein VGV86_03250, partial [Acidimicrobiales bacterium]|nr:hypothetical protein [Acidimicrobiales bacterium]
MRRLVVIVLALGLLAAACSDSDTGSSGPTTAGPTTSAPVTDGTGPTTTAAERPTTSQPRPTTVELQVTEVARGLEVPWSLAWDPGGALWFTQRTGALTRLNGPSRDIAGVTPIGEGGLMGLEIDRQGRMFVMYTGAQDNRIVRLEPDGSQKVLVSGIARAAIHDGGRLRFGP